MIRFRDIMLEETQLFMNSMHHARINACMKQCRIIQFQNGKNLLDGSCPCDGLADCRFVEHDVDDGKDWFPDRLNYLRQLSEE